MSKGLLIGLGALVGACGALLATAGTSLANPPAIAPPAVVASPRVPLKVPAKIVATKVLETSTSVTITCPDNAPYQTNWENGWMQVTWGGTLRTQSPPIYTPAENLVQCLYVLNNDPNNVVTSLENHPPAGVKNCRATSDNKSIQCDK